MRVEFKVLQKYYRTVFAFHLGTEKEYQLLGPDYEQEYQLLKYG